jgi:hypothetical protein
VARPTALGDPALRRWRLPTGKVRQIGSDRTPNPVEHYQPIHGAPLPLNDPQFGEKLKEVEKAVGFRFPASAFSNAFLAELLGTTAETMSRKKSGKRRVTERDWSTLTSHFDLARYGFEPTMFALELPSFAEVMRAVGLKALGDAKPNKARQDLMELATGPCGGRLVIRVARGRLRNGGIGTEPNDAGMPTLLPGDRVQVQVSAPRQGHMYLLNDNRKEVACLMPSYYAPSTAVKAGDVVIPTREDLTHFPVGGPINTYRLYALWFAAEPPVALSKVKAGDRPPRNIESTEFIEIVEYARQMSSQAGTVMVAFGDYIVK